MRTLTEIKTEMELAFMGNATLQEKYGFAAGAHFADTFSKVSIENLLLYIVAAAIYVHERLFEAHKNEITTLIENETPHTLRRYASKAKAYQQGCALVEGTDQYDNSNLKDSEVEAAKIVKYAAAYEEGTSVFLKLAKDNDGHPSKIDDDELLGVKAYLNEVKDAGVRLVVTSTDGNRFWATLHIYYNPAVLTLTEGANEAVNTAIKNYIEGLPFNGEYTNAALCDALQAVEGVVIPTIVKTEIAENGISHANATTILVRCTPSAGYFTYEPNNITITYEPYEANGNDPTLSINE